MPVIPNGHAYHRVRFAYPGDNELMIVTLGTVWTSGTEPLLTLTTAVASTFQVRLLPIAAFNLSLVDVLSTGRSATGALEEASVAVGAGGTRNVPFLPQNNACLVQKRTGLAGRANRGRMYFPYILSETDVSDVGAIAAGSLATTQTAMTNILTDLNGAAVNRDMVILHSAGVAAPPVVTQLLVSPTIATQRRRLRP